MGYQRARHQMVQTHLPHRPQRIPAVLRAHGCAAAPPPVPLWRPPDASPQAPEGGCSRPRSRQRRVRRWPPLLAAWRSRAAARAHARSRATARGRPRQLPAHDLAACSTAATCTNGGSASGGAGLGGESASYAQLPHSIPPPPKPLPTCARPCSSRSVVSSSSSESTASITNHCQSPLTRCAERRRQCDGHWLRRSAGAMRSRQPSTLPTLPRPRRRRPRRSHPLRARHRGLSTGAWK